MSDAIAHPQLRDLYLLWVVKRQDRMMPMRNDFLPEDFKEWMPHIGIYDVEREPLRLRARLLGTMINRYDGRDHTGLYLDQMFSGKTLDKLMINFGRCVGAREIVYDQGRHLVQGSVGRDYAALFLPLSLDGHSVDQVLTAAYLVDAGGLTAVPTTPARTIFG